MNFTPCLVIRGISDFADSHKPRGKAWHPYAATAAASFAKEFIEMVPVEAIVKHSQYLPTLLLELLIVPLDMNFLTIFNQLSEVSLTEADSSSLTSTCEKSYIFLFHLAGIHSSLAVSLKCKNSWINLRRRLKTTASKLQ